MCHSTTLNAMSCADVNSFSKHLLLCDFSLSKELNPWYARSCWRFGDRRQSRCLQGHFFSIGKLPASPDWHQKSQSKQVMLGVGWLVGWFGYRLVVPCKRRAAKVELGICVIEKSPSESFKSTFKSTLFWWKMSLISTPDVSKPPVFFFTFSTFADRCALQNHDFDEKNRANGFTHIPQEIKNGKCLAWS